MKIKKATQVIILVVALVSVIGVGAVSYAAWDGAGHTLTAQAEIGSVELFGFDADLADSAMGTLVPYDQTTGTLNGTTIVTKALPSYTVAGAWKMTISSENLDGLKIYAKLGDSTTVAPVKAEGQTDEQALDGWTLITDAGVVLSEGSNYGQLNADGTQYLCLILVSNDVNQMNHAAVNFTVAVEKAA